MPTWSMRLVVYGVCGDATCYTARQRRTGMKTLTVILEYCGGRRTDHLVERLRSWNPGREIAVLDNASPSNRCSYITHSNACNTYVGGGIIDCYKLAESRNCDNLFFIV